MTRETTLPTTENKGAIGVQATAARTKVGLALRDFSMAIALLGICAFFTVASPTFVSARNLSNLAVELSITCVLALGMLLVIVTSNVDLSAGSGVGLFGGLAAVLIFERHWPAPAAMVVSLAVALAVWTAMGAIIVKQKVPAFIVTLAGLLVFKGLHWTVIHNATIPIIPGGVENPMSRLTTYYVPPRFGYVLALAITLALVWGKAVSRRLRRLARLEVEPFEISFGKVFVGAQLLFLFVLVTGQYRGIPLSALVLGAVAFAAWVLTQETRAGRYLYAIGGNEEAARISGIPVDKMTIMAFSIMGGIVAITGFMQTAYSGASTTTVGELMELDAIAACVIGGTSLRGGRGSVLGVLFGALITTTLLNGMTLMAVSPEIKFIARGSVLALAVWMDVKLSKGS